MARTILILAANPKDTQRLRLDQEVREIEDGLQRAQRRDAFVLRQKWATRPVDVRRAMLDFRPSIVHFCGHGEGEEGIAFEDETGRAKLVGAEALAGLFELFADTVECVVLNACHSEIQAEAIAQYIDYVIGMKKGLGDMAAIAFAVAFYDALGAGKSIEFAHKLACNAIQWAGTPEHLIPTLKSKRVATSVEGTSRSAFSVIDGVFDELTKCISVMFTHPSDRDTTTSITEMNLLKSKLVELKVLGLEDRKIYALEHYIAALIKLLEAYRYMLNETGSPNSHEVLAQKLDDAAFSFNESHTDLGRAFSLFFTAWALIKRTKQLYSDPSQMEMVLKRHKQEIPEVMLASSHQFQEHPMAAFARGEANYSMGWGFVFEALSAPTSLHQARLLDQAADDFELAATNYAEADIDRVHESIAEADHCLFQAIAFTLLSQRKGLSSQVRIENLQRARVLLTEAISLFLSVQRVVLAAAILKMLLVVEKERVILERAPSKEEQTLDNLVRSLLADKQLTGIEVLQSDILKLANLHAVSRMPEMLLQSQMFLEVISVIRKSDQEDLKGVLAQAVSPGIPAMFI